MLSLILIIANENSTEKIPTQTSDKSNVDVKTASLDEKPVFTEMLRI